MKDELKYINFIIILVQLQLFIIIILLTDIRNLLEEPKDFEVNKAHYLLEFMNQSPTKVSEFGCGLYKIPYVTVKYNYNPELEF